MGIQPERETKIDCLLGRKVESPLARWVKSVKLPERTEVAIG